MCRACYIFYARTNRCSTIEDQISNSVQTLPEQGQARVTHLVVGVLQRRLKAGNLAYGMEVEEELAKERAGEGLGVVSWNHMRNLARALLKGVSSVARNVSFVDVAGSTVEQVDGQETTCA